MELYQALAAALVDHGLDTVFGLMGDANMRYLSEFRDRGGTFVAAVHESNAVSMADSYARACGRVGVASVTQGPGLSNTLTGLTEAARSRTPLLLLSGDPPPEATHFQRLDVSSVAAAAGAGYEQIYRTRSFMRDVNRAVQRAVAEQRPILLNVPTRLLREDVGAQPPASPPVAPPPAPAPAEALDAALGLVASANRPVVLAGRGAIASGAEAELVGLAERLGAPLATTLLAKGAFAGHPHNLGIFGNLSHSVALEAVGEADCVVAFGASLNIFTAFHGELVRGKRIVQVDTDPTRFGWFTPVDEAVPGDARLVAAQMNAALDTADHEPHTAWVAQLAGKLAAHSPREDFTDRSGADTVDVRSAMIRLDELLPAERSVVTDVGRFAVGVWPYVAAADPRRFTVMGGFGAIGLGMAGAVGAAVARPEELTVALVGDGGFMMHLGEFHTAVREQLPILVVVLNDGAYGAEYFRLVHYGVDTSAARFAWPSMAAMAESMGARGLEVRAIEQLAAVPKALAEDAGPVLVDVKLDPDVNIID